MSSIPNGFPISLKTWPSNTKIAIDLPTFFQRVNSERGGLTKFNEASLREEIDKEEAAKSQGVELGNGDDEERKDVEEEKGKKVATREELLSMLASANQSAMFALEFISLAISKDLPTQASETMSQHLRDRVGMGTLGASKASTSWAKPELAENNKRIARGRKTQDVKRTVDTILASATRLEKEIELETNYWSQVLALSDQGWNVCKMPRSKGVLGVRFGSSEITPLLQNQGLVGLKRTDLGVEIQGNPMTAEPKAMRVRIQVNGLETGCSNISPPIPDTETSAHPALLQARNTLFALELWHEVNRESRNLGAYGIYLEGDTLVFTLTAKKRAILDLVSINDYTPPDSQPDDNIAQGLALSLSLMLSYAHRQTHRRRTRPPKPITNPKRIAQLQSPPNKQPNVLESPAILRPMLIILNHQNSITSLTTLFTSLLALLRKASFSSPPTFNSTRLAPPLPATLSTPERTIASLTNLLSTNFSLTLIPTTTLHINIRTSIMSALPISIFTLGITPEGSHTSCPPPNQLGAFDQVETFVYFYTASVLASSFQAQGKDSDVGRWYATPSPVTLRYDSSKGFGSEKWLKFMVLRAGSGKSEERKGLKLKVTWAPEGDETDGSGSPNKQTHMKKKKKEGERSYEWIVWEGASSSDDVFGFEDGESEVVRSLEDVVDVAARKG